MDKDWRDRMREIADRKMLTAVEISRRTGLSTASLSFILSKKRNTKLDNIKLIAEALEVSPEYLLHGIDVETKTATVLKVPVLEEHDVMDWLEDPEQFHNSDTKWMNCFIDDCSPSTFAMKVLDSDMIDPTGYDSFPPGTIIFVDPELNPFVDGERVAIGLYALIQLEDRTIIFRQLERATGRWYAAPRNPKYESIPIDPKKTKFIGTVLAQAMQYIKHNMN